LAVGRERRNLAEIVVVRDMPIARPDDLRRMLTLETLLRFLVAPVLAREPGQRDTDRAWRARRILEFHLRIDRVRVGTKRHDLADSQTIVRAGEHELLRRLVGRDG